MKRIYPKLGRECRERQFDAGRFNPSRIAKVVYKGKTHICVLSCGDSDSTYFWQDGTTVYVLSINEGLGYCGIEAFTLQGTPNKYTNGINCEAEKTDGPFLQADHEVESVLGKRGLDLSPATIKNRLLEYFTC